MDDAQASQAGETEQTEEFEELETKLFLVGRPRSFITHSVSSLKSVRLTVSVLQLPGSTPTAASFEFRDEGHTLGNALRYIIMKK